MGVRQTLCGHLLLTCGEGSSLFQQTWVVLGHLLLPCLILSIQAYPPCSPTPMSAEWRISQFSSVAQLCLTLCDPMNCSMPGIPGHHQLPEFTQTHVHWVTESVMSSNHLILCWPFSSCLQCFPGSGSFQIGRLFASGGQSIRVSASTSVLPMNIQDWFPLGWTGWISLQSKGLSSLLQHHSSKVLL